MPCRQACFLEREKAESTLSGSLFLRLQPSPSLWQRETSLPLDHTFGSFFPFPLIFRHFSSPPPPLLPRLTLFRFVFFSPRSLALTKPLTGYRVNHEKRRTRKELLCLSKLGNPPQPLRKSSNCSGGFFRSRSYRDFRLYFSWLKGALLFVRAESRSLAILVTACCLLCRPCLFVFRLYP